MSETDLEATTEEEGGKESEIPGEGVEDNEEEEDENEQNESDANEEWGEQEEDYEEKEGDEEYGEEEEEEGEEKKEVKKAGVKAVGKKDEPKDGSEEEVSEEEDIYAEKTEGDEKADIKAEKRMSLAVDDDDDDEEEDEYEDEEEEDYISGPYLSHNSTVSENFLEFYHSFGYDCRRHYNLCIPDPNTIIFASGNYIHFYDIEAKEVTFRRTARGGGIGHIVKNPNPKYPHVAVAEKGLNPLIIIYQWPSMEHIRVLRGGAKRAYACLNYSPDGRFLCSQGCEPDHFLTVWNWKKGRILRQQKAYGQDVFNAMFSNYSLGNLTTSGYGHIKFWKLAKTFTGLKLMGSIGRFGKTEMCDIVGFIALPDEQVISGCEWGNMLIWNEGLVKAEVCRKAGASCHDGYISQLLYDDKDEEIITVGTDGFIRAWDFKLIEKADLVGDSPKIKLENLYALEVGKGYDKSSLLYIEKQDSSEKCLWFAQDGNGGIWLVDLDQDQPAAPEKLFRCHAGGVRSVAACPYDTYVASYGDDGRLLFYNYATRRLVLQHKFAAGGGFLVWLDTSVEPTGDVVVCGGADGLVRVAVVALQKREAAGAAARDDDFVCLVQTTKPHTRRITHMAVRQTDAQAPALLVTGSEDATVFVYQILPRHDYVSLNPIGFVNVPSAVTHLAWKPNDEKPMILVSCFGGQAVLMELPDSPQVDTKVSYELKNIVQKEIVFLSVKSQLRRDVILQQDAERRQEKLEMKKKKLKAMKEENPNLKIDEELFLEDSESSISLESLYFPEVPSPILFALYLTNDIIWMNPGGYDAGYVYEYLVDMEDPVRCTLIADADDIEIHSYIHDPSGEYLILGMQDGKIRVCRKNPDNIADLSDYWLLSMHDNDNGIIPQMCFSYDNKFMFSCGHDGNVFAYVVESEIHKPSIRKLKKSAPWPSDSLEDITDPEMYSLEQLKQKAEHDRKMKLANDHKQEVLESLAKLKEKFASLAQSNKALPLKLRIPYGEFKIDPRIEDDLEDELEDKLALEKRKLAFQAEKSAIGLKKLQDYFYNVLDSHLVTIRGLKNTRLKAYTFRSRALGPEFQQAKKFVTEKLDKAKLQRPAGARGTKFAPSTSMKHRLRLGTWLKGIGSVGTNIKMNVKLQRMLLKYYERKRAKELREEQWNRMMQMKPDPKVSHPEDVAAMEQAEKTIGDFKMKTDHNYTVNKEQRVTTDKKYLQLLITREKVHDIQKQYNDRVYHLRDKKVNLITHINELNERLAKRQKELPPSDIKHPQPLPEVVKEEEFPERELTLQEEDILAYYPTPPPSASAQSPLARGREGSYDEELQPVHQPSLARTQARSLARPSQPPPLAHLLSSYVQAAGGAPPPGYGDEEDYAPEDAEEEDGDEFYLGVEDVVRLALRHRHARPPGEPRLDADYEILLVDPTAPPPPLKTRRSLSGLRKGHPPCPFPRHRFLSDVDVRRFVFRSRRDQRDTPWEREMRCRRLCKSRYIQESILKEIDQSTDQFDKEITQVKDARFSVAVDIKFGELHIIKLHQELIILKEFESVEDALALKVHNTEEEMHSVNNEILDKQMDIENHKKEIENLELQIKQLGAIFNEKIEDNSYADFLRKIYKKKYKPPKVKKGDDESSSSSSEESSDSSEEEEEEEDEGSMDSQDMGIIKLDESICPPDLDRALYDMTFDMRTQRHQLEIKETEEKKSIDNLKKEIDLKGKSIRVLEKTLATQKDELLAFQREKQHRLNEVMCVVALKASQLRYFEDAGADLDHMSDKIVFSRAMLGRLQARVGELHKETHMQEHKFRRYKQHHLRMHIDCKHMRKEIKELKKIIELTLIKKFGNVVNVEDLEDIVLQRLIVQLRTTLHEIKEEFYRLVAMFKEERRKQECILTGLCRSNSEKMNVLTILTQEKSNLTKLMPLEDKTRKYTARDVLASSEELRRLRRVVKNQAQQMQTLRGEIRQLSYKGQQPPLVVCTPSGLEAEVRRLRALQAEKEKLPEVSSDEEDEDEDTMFLYMEPRHAERLVAQRARAPAAPRWPTVDQVLADLLRRVPLGPDEDDERAAVRRRLDHELDKLINKIPKSTAAESILEEFTDMLDERLAANADPEDTREALLDMDSDMKGMPSGPGDVRYLFHFALGRLKEREAGVHAAVSARLIIYDVLRKCIGYVYGKHFFLATEDAILQVLDTLDPETDGRVLMDDVIFYLEEHVQSEEARARPQMTEVLEDVLHDLRSLQDDARPAAVFRTAFEHCRERAGNERDLAAARRFFHDALKRAIGVVAETSFPVSEMGMLPPDQAVTMLLARLPHDAPSPSETALELLDEMRIVLEWRDPAVDDAATQALVATLAPATDADAHADALRDAPALQRHFDGVLKALARDGARAGAKSLFQAQSVLCETVHRALAFVLPALDVQDVVHLLEPAAVVLALLDKVPAAADTAQLFHDVVEELSEKNKTELFSEGVQAELPRLIQRLQQVEDKKHGMKNTIADVMQEVKGKKLFKSDTVCLLKLLEDAIRYSIGVHYPELTVCDDEEVKGAQSCVLGFLKYVPPKECAALFRELCAALAAWEPKSSDPPEIAQMVAQMVAKVRSLPEKTARKKKNMSYVLKLICSQARTKQTALRVLYVLKLCLKAAVRAVVPGVALEDEQCLFNPDDTTLAMLHKVPESPYVDQLSDKLQEQLKALMSAERTTKGQRKVYALVQSALQQLQPEEEDEAPDVHAAVQKALSAAKALPVPKAENVYARIYLNDAVRRCMGQVFPRTDIQDAKCSMDKERSTLLMLKQIPYEDDVLVLYDEIRSEMETRCETIEARPEVRKAIHDVIAALSVEPADVARALEVFEHMYMDLCFQDMPRLASLTAKNIFYHAVKKCIENVFPFVDLDDALVVDKEWPILQMLGQLPFARHYTELIARIIQELEKEEAAAEGRTKELIAAFKDKLSGRALEHGNLFLIRPCFLKIKDMHPPVRYFRPFKEAAYAAIKRAIQAVYPAVDLQDNESAWEHEEALLAAALRMPPADDTSVLIDELRERIDAAKDCEESPEARALLQEVQNHLTVMPLEPASFEHLAAAVFTVLRARRGDKKDIARVRSVVYGAMRGTLALLKEKLQESHSDAHSPKSTDEEEQEED